MTIKQKRKTRKIKIDLSGVQGNAFCLLGLAQDISRKLEKTEEEIDKIRAEMKSGDYENLIQVLTENLANMLTYTDRGRE